MVHYEGDEEDFEEVNALVEEARRLLTVGDRPAFLHYVLGQIKDIANVLAEDKNRIMLAREKALKEAEAALLCGLYAMTTLLEGLQAKLAQSSSAVQESADELYKMKEVIISSNKSRLPVSHREEVGVWGENVHEASEEKKGFMRHITRFPVTLAMGIIVLIVLFSLFGLYYNEILSAATRLAEFIRNTPGGFLIIVAIVFLVSFPPGLGYGLSIILSGFVYGFPLGVLPVVAGGTIGACTCFATFRYFGFNGYIKRVTDREEKYAAITEAIADGGFTILLLIRLTPLTFGISNAVISSIPQITFFRFACATFISLWKNLFAVWIGSRLSKLEDRGGDKVANYLFIAIGVLLLGGVSGYMYWATMKKVRKISAERRAIQMEDRLEEGAGLVEGDTLRESQTDHPEPDFCDLPYSLRQTKSSNMRSAFIALVFFSAFALASITSCGSKSDIVAVSLINVDPDPAILGQDLTITAKGYFKEDVTAGNLILTVTLTQDDGSELPLINNQTMDLCATIQPYKPCPIRAGPQNIPLSFTIPANFIATKIQAHAEAFKSDGSRILCIDGDLEFQSA
ncbi:hypothetical protein PROFUN_11836 [Planoprotostelium fungivorum]|uniref:Golgi apparatus membrane protein TVP38 n=1 Tax=Planoprotostelium fungivorum TaxID=1890364 RepID=A0A2P6N995_9EUKA|nr:hypothetical protein PROFUN_11836 [Planoprotostelium fungivorum]